MAKSTKTLEAAAPNGQCSQQRRAANHRRPLGTSCRCRGGGPVVKATGQGLLDFPEPWGRGQRSADFEADPDTKTVTRSSLRRDLVGHA